MANIQIPNLPAVTALTGDELFEGVQAGSSVKISLGQMIAAARTGLPTTVPLPVSAGGTGTTTSTGTGSVVLSDNPTLVNASISVGTFGLGAVGAPSITFTGDTNTGIWSPGAETIAFSTAGAERMRINSAGNVGIGTTNPVTKLDIAAAGTLTARIWNTANNAVAGFDASNATGTGLFGVDATGVFTYTGTALPIRFSTNANERMRVHASGGVSIGNTTDPGATNLSVTGVGSFGLGTALLPSYTFNGDTNTGMWSPAADTVAFSTNGAERMRIDASGNVGIGGIPSAPLDVRGANGLGIRYIETTTGNTNRIQLGTGSGFGYIDATAGIGSVYLAFQVASTERMRIDAAGNLGLGVTPSAWGSNYKAIESAANSQFILAGGNVNGVGLLSNAYADNTNFLYKTTSPASYYSVDGATHRWYNAPSGTAGNAITFTQAMTLDNVGNLGIGITPSPWGNSASIGKALDFTKGGIVSLNGGPADHVGVFANAYAGTGTDPGTATWNYKATGFATLYEGGRTGTHRWFTAPSGTAGAAITFTERLRIADAGQIGIGGANYGTTGQTILSGGPSAAPTWGTLGLAGGGTGVTTAPAAAAVLMGYTTTATAAGTTVLTNTSSQYQLFTGTTTQTITLPVTSTLTTGWNFHIVNSSTGNLTINSSGGNLVGTVIPGTTAMVTCILASGTTAASWEFGVTDFNTLTGTGSVVMSVSPTLVTPTLGTGSFDLGAVGTPSITFTSDANTGIWSPAADTLAVSTNGTERLRIDSAGSITQPNAVSGSGVIVGEQVFRLAADGAAIGPTIADFFGASSSISLEASSVYEITIYAIFTKTTAGTATFTLTASSAPTRMVGTYQASPITGIAAGADTSGFAGSQGAATAAFAATGSLSTAVNHAYQFSVQVQTNAASSFKLQITQSAGTATPLAGSYYTVKKIAATTGTFV